MLASCTRSGCSASSWRSKSVSWACFTYRSNGIATIRPHYGSAMATLVLLRHGESEWNKKNLFTGWVDVDLTGLGEEQARLGGLELKKADLLPTVLHTSLLTRAIRTSNIALESCERNWIPVKRHWRLNERHYGG